MAEFIPHPQAEVRRQSIAQLIRIIISIEDRRVLAEQKLQAIDTLLWKFTEADGKHNTPYRSIAAINVKDKALLRHEHVSTRSDLKHRLLSARPEDVDHLLQQAVGCLVTVEEHERLSTFDRLASGWERYERAGVQWTDLRKR